MSNSATNTTDQPGSAASVGSSFHDCWLYLRSFCRSGLNVASLVPSSRWTAQALLRDIDFSRRQTILELGAGTGAVTAPLLQASAGRSRTIIVERDPVFYERLCERFPTAEIVASDALDLHRILRHQGIDKVDHVISTLPINWLTAEDQGKLLTLIRQHMSPAGTFRQLTHVPGLHRALYRRHFASVKCPLVLRNFPPAACYICREPRPLTDNAG